MNIYYLIAAILAIISQIGHLTVGSREFLKPILDSEHLPSVVKGVVHSLFHYMTFIIGVTAIALLYFTFYSSYGPIEARVIGVISGYVWIGMGLVALALSFKYGLFRIFQWIFWFAIGALALIGSNY
ncbi:MAG: hypothetical protein ACRCZM_10770 [Bacteroidales bacterium]